MHCWSRAWHATTLTLARVSRIERPHHRRSDRRRRPPVGLRTTASLSAAGPPAQNWYGAPRSRARPETDDEMIVPGRPECRTLVSARSPPHFMTAAPAIIKIACPIVLAQPYPASPTRDRNAPARGPSRNSALLLPATSSRLRIAVAAFVIERPCRAPARSRSSPREPVSEK